MRHRVAYSSVSLPPDFSMATKQSQAELIRLLETGIREVGDLEPNRFFIMVRNVVATGSPPSLLRASVLLRFLPGGEPYCCSEPGCYSSVFRDTGIDELGDYMRRKMSLHHAVSVDLHLDVEYYDDISFSSHRGA